MVVDLPEADMAVPPPMLSDDGVERARRDLCSLRHKMDEENAIFLIYFSSQSVVQYSGPVAVYVPTGVPSRPPSRP